MTSLIYKTLFEVKLMHEFFLTDQTGKTVFSLLDQEERKRVLLDEYARDNDSINQDLSFEIPRELKQQYEHLNLRLLPTYSGFKLAVRVKQVLLPDNALVYE